MKLSSREPRDLAQLSREYVSLTKAVSVIDTALRKYCSTRPDSSSEPVFDLDKVLIAFNGGKDCTLMLHLIALRARALPRIRGSLRLMYIQEPEGEEFPEVHDFVEETKSRYDLESIEVNSGDLRAGLESIVAHHPEVQAIFMGTRSTDPNAGWMDYFCRTSPGWPQVDLVAPILHMKYAELWSIINELNVEVCEMYKRGYTSIGHVSDTVANPALLTENGTYLHADQLKDESLERLGRLKNKKEL